ncbi:EF-hand and coiled-coil domain-containing protein 1-like [Carcharodon carcharias]|uniref:EF-hand and coiled-coil domain-containing protein 1-like n=1 Tax=Carcharodon carcharias TaxID=13397 RepID=UPI001B7DD09E|nr:EF-hand and coiled-coil domain-containing protein 1-like [Carcharodon carcharias]
MLGCSEPAARPVRRTAWLVSALSHHLGPEGEGEGGQVDNEVVVLATGVDQYLQETFHHLDGEGDGLISGEDFRRLCSVLGLPENGAPAGLLAGLPAELTFRQFHARLCEHFQQRGEEGPGRLPVGEETEHIERQIRLRCPRRRRRRRKQQQQQQCVSFDLSAQGWRPRPTAGAPQGRGAPAAAAAAAAAAPPLELELENASLRELVEDLRGALQSSDARCLALQVGLQKVGGPSGRSSWPRERRARSGEGRCSARQSCRGFQSLVRELELIRSSRDGQIDEAMRFNQELEEELRAAHGLLVQWEHSASALKAGNALVRKKAERARAAILEGMEKVKELESRAKQIPELQSRIQELEQELERCRSQEGQGKKAPALLNSSQPFQKYCRSSQSDWNPSCQQTRSPPTGKADSVSESRECSWHNGNPSCNEDEGRLLRAVEGRAASDEEEERCTQDRPCQMMELNKDSGSGEGCRSSTLQPLLSHNCSCANKESGSIVPPIWMEREQELSVQLKNKEKQVTELQTETEKWTCSMTKELQLKGEEVEMLRMELQMVETDRVRLSLIEEKLTDVLQLLQQLRVLNIPRRLLGKILMNTLDSCYSAGHGTMGSLDMLSVLHKELLSCELLTKGSSQTENQQGMKNSLVISC